MKTMLIDGIEVTEGMEYIHHEDGIRYVSSEDGSAWVPLTEKVSSRMDCGKVTEEDIGEYTVVPEKEYCGQCGGMEENMIRCSHCGITTCQECTGRVEKCWYCGEKWRE